MQINDLDEFLNKYIEGYLFEDLASVKRKVPKDIHPGNAAYLMAMATCSGIELVGMLLTKFKVIAACDCCGRKETIVSEFPIERFCNKYMTKVDPLYEGLGPVLKVLIRNGLAHSFATKGKVGVTRRGRRSETHLVRMTKEGFIVLNANEFYSDFKKAYYQFAKPDLLPGGPKHGIALDNYQHLQKTYGDEIEAIMSGIEGKLKLPVVYEDVDLMDHMVDEVEATGGLQFVS